MRPTPTRHRLLAAISAGLMITAVGMFHGATASVGAEESTTTPAAAETTVAAGPVDKTGWPTKIVFGAVPSENATSLQESYANVIALLKDQLGIDVEFFQATDYAGIIEAQIAGKVDLAQYGPFSYVIAKKNGAKIDPVGVMVSKKDAKPGYQSYGIVKGDNAEITDLKGFKGKKVCFVDPGSTSGYLYPSAGLLAEGIDPTKDVTPVFAGGHDASALSVVNGDCDAGFAFDAMVDTQLISKGEIKAGDLKVVWKSEMIAGSPIAVRTELPASLVAEIKRIITTEANVDAFIASGRCPAPAEPATTVAGATTVPAKQTCKVTDEGSWGWVPGEDSMFDGVRAVCEQTKATKCQG